METYKKATVVYHDPLNKTFTVRCPYCEELHKHGGIPKNDDTKISHCNVIDSLPYLISIVDRIPNKNDIDNQKEIKPKHKYRRRF